MENFKTKNFFWVLLWVSLPYILGDRVRLPMFNVFGVPQGYFYNLLGFAPLILMGVYNYLFIKDKPTKKHVIRAYRISIFAFIYFGFLMMILAYKGAFLVPVYVSPLGFFIAKTAKYLKGFLPK